MKHLACLFALLSLSYSYSQKETIIRGTVRSSLTKDILISSKIASIGTLSETYTDVDGHFRIVYRQNAIGLLITCPGYIDKMIVGKPMSDTTIFLDPQPTNLDEITVTANEFQTLIKNTKFNILDYGFAADNLLLLTVTLRKQQCLLQLISPEMDTISTLEIPGHTAKIWRDCLGNNHIICTNEAYQVVVDNNELFLLDPVPLEKIEKILYPCVAADEEHLYFMNKTGAEDLEMKRLKIQKHNFHLEYYAVNRKTKKRTNIWAITDEVIVKLRMEESLFLDQKEEQGFYDLYLGPSGDKGNSMGKEADRILAETILFREIYAPLVILNDSLMIFDYPNAKCRFNPFDINTVSLTHQKREDWSRNMYFDKKAGKAYAQFESKGVISLEQLDPNTGLLSKPTVLPILYPENIQTQNGFAYFLAMDKVSGTTYYLSRVPLK